MHQIKITTTDKVTKAHPMTFITIEIREYCEAMLSQLAYL